MTWLRVGRKKKHQLEVATHFRDEADKRLKEATERGAEITDNAEWSRKRRKKNHLAELWYQQMQEHKP